MAEGIKYPAYVRSSTIHNNDIGLRARTRRKPGKLEAMVLPLARMARRNGVARVALAAAGILSFVVVVTPYAEARQPRVKVPRAAVAPPPSTATHSAARNPAVTGRDAILVIDAASGRELDSSHADEPRHPASLTKMMTLYLVFEALDGGRLRLGDKLPVSARAVGMQPTRMGLVAGSTVMVRDAVMGLIVRSANDAAVVLAEAMAGDEGSFAQLMTQRARQLGMTTTTFRNASGLPHHAQVTTARDMAALGRALLRDFPHYYPLFSVQSYAYGPRVLQSHNRLLNSYAGADGIKTGYINSSGFNLVTSAVRGDRRLIGVVLGGDSAGERDAIMASVLDVSFAEAGRQGVPAWRTNPTPPTARYAAAHFSPSVRLPETRPTAVAAVRGGTANDAGRPVEPVAAGSAVADLRARAGATGGTGDSMLGRWALQIGAFADQNAASKALSQALSAVPDLRRDTSPLVEQFVLAGKTLYRARLLAGSEDHAVRSCRRLEAQKIFCSPVEIGTWSRPR
jgi:D-alanyl-D-alanine carboxypeptidase